MGLVVVAVGEDEDAAEEAGVAGDHGAHRDGALRLRGVPRRGLRPGDRGGLLQLLCECVVFK